MSFLSSSLPGLCLFQNLENDISDSIVLIDKTRGKAVSKTYLCKIKNLKVFLKISFILIYFRELTQSSNSGLNSWPFLKI